MKYSRRHYEDTARILNEGAEAARRGLRAGALTEEAARARCAALTGTAYLFAVLYDNDSPRFDGERFLRACRLDLDADLNAYG